MIDALAVVLCAVAFQPASQPGAAASAPAKPGDPLPELVVSHDDTAIDHSCRVTIAPGKLLQDFNGNGIIQIVKPGIVVEFAPDAVLRGAVYPAEPDVYSGVGIYIQDQKDITIRGAR